MFGMLRPVGFTLTGRAILFCALCVACAIANPAAGEDPLKDIKDFHARFQSPGYFSSSGCPSIAPAIIREQIPLGADPAGLNGLVSVNADRQRDILFDGALSASAPSANTMGIEVSGVTVIAINTVKGGNAVATSNIILSPVQRIGSSGAEAEEKLK